VKEIVGHEKSPETLSGDFSVLDFRTVVNHVRKK